jgi:hypothetical protein
MARRSAGALFIGIGLAVALGLAFFVSPLASSSPDGLERVAADEGFAATADDHALADGPLTDYTVRDVDDDRLAAGLAGVVGVAICFGVGAVSFVAIRALRTRRGLGTDAGSVRGR